ncbi:MULTISPECIES: sigma-70 family RNA polymerase sigma factor [Vibrio]|uniref:sigma-70 family RNA polymerase sigma factor n=1 Tax=Vibrio TaxID=662 RepID=UPI000841A0C0|nr:MULTISPECIES: sigma-70 family RNA polymerase sigma factor [Vibrio]ODM56872.1 hypothetical protein BC455_18605 [Vibrio harveyi]USD58487.1 sigma-70 family RNA polymerase sigma factor [Vibrio sp. SCSIO 43155]
MTNFATQEIETSNEMQLYRDDPKGFIEEYRCIVFWCLEEVSSWRSNSYEDLESIANLELIEAVHRFDPRKGVKFQTYASKRIIKSLIANFSKEKLVTVDKNMAQLARGYNKYKEIEGGSIEEYCAKFELTHHTGTCLKWLVQVLYHHGSQLEWNDEIDTSGDADTELIKEVERDGVIEIVNESISHLSDKEQEVAKAYFRSIENDTTLKTELQSCDQSVLGLSDTMIYRLRSNVCRHIRECFEMKNINIGQLM